MKLLRPDIKSMNHKKENFDILDPIKKKKKLPLQKNI